MAPLHLLLSIDNNYQHKAWFFIIADDPVDPEMEPEAAQQETQESAQDQEEEDDDETDPAVLAKKQKQLAKRGVTFEAKVDPKVTVSATKLKLNS